MESRVILDQGTIRDLELLGTADGGPGLIALLDRTATRDGAAAFRRRLLEPMSSDADIRGVQGAVGFLANRGVRHFTKEPEVSAVKRYLNSNVEPVGGRSSLVRAAKSLWLRVRYPDVLREMEAGVSATRGFLRRFRDFCSHLSTEDVPTELRERVYRCQALLDSPGLTDVVGPARGRASTVAHDRVLRRTRLDAMRELLAQAAELDALVAMARTTEELGFVLPVCSPSDGFVLEGEGLYHPVLTDPVKNRFRLSDGESLVFLTGPNMAGKTTYLKAAGLALLLAHAGMGVPADSLRFSPVDCLFTSIGTGDDMRAGLSQFMAEVVRVREVATILAKGYRAFVLFDEVFRGTNLHDALEASKAVMRGFARCGSSGFVFSSHLVELVDELEDLDSVRFAYFDGEIADGAARYTYELKDGYSAQRLGLQLLRQEGVPDLLRQIEE